MTKIFTVIAVGLLVTAAGGHAVGQTPPAQGDFIVTLLGTGSPIPYTERLGPATLVQAGGQNLLFDSGRGATIRLTQAGVSVGDVTAVFLTHFHSDHVSGLADVWLTGWLPAGFGGRSTPFRVYGPPGTEALMAGLESAHRADVRIRIADERLPPAGAEVDTTEGTEGVIYERGGVRVSVFDVDHGALIKPSVGYRVDFGGRSVVISGDTRFSPTLIEHAKNVNLLIHEVMTVPPEMLDGSESLRRVMDHHTSAEDAGRVFAETTPALAVYTHVIVLGYEDPEAGLRELIRRTRTTYSGPLEVGYDLMRLAVSETPRVLPRLDGQ